MSEVTEKCTLSDADLIEKAEEWVSKLCKSGGKDWCLRVPVDFFNDPDIIFTELADRYKNLISLLKETKCNSFEYTPLNPIEAISKDARDDNTLPKVAIEYSTWKKLIEYAKEY